MNFAIIKTGGKQYKVSKGDVLMIEKLDTVEENVVFSEVLLMAEGDKVTLGKPMISGATVEAKVVEHGKDKKKMVFKYKSKTRHRKKKGHRQPFTKVQITKISA
ncbi:MAG: 50S ribosomal protein L21 [Patescibacteria group bacterium]